MLVLVLVGASDVAPVEALLQLCVLGLGLLQDGDVGVAVLDWRSRFEV